MHPRAECPDWEYADDPHRAAILFQEGRAVLQKIHGGELTFDDAVLDTRPVHAQLFSRLVPPKISYLVGRYRGEDHKCLRHLPVHIPINPLVGSPAEVVHEDLKAFARLARSTVRGLDHTMALPSAILPPEEKLKYLIAGACHLFSDFLIIHPYANGNGHVARVMLTWIMARYGYWLGEFPIEPRPREPEYSEAIRLYQGGNVKLLEEMVYLSVLSGGDL